MNKVMQLALNLLMILGLMTLAAKADQTEIHVLEDEEIWPPEPGVSEIGPPDRHDFYIVPEVAEDTRHYIDPGPLVKPEAPEIIILEEEEPIDVPPNSPSAEDLPDLYAPAPDQRAMPVDDYIKDAFTGKLPKKCGHSDKGAEQGADDNRGVPPVEEATNE